MNTQMSDIDKLVCAQLVSTYASYVDHRRYNDLIELFTEDGVLRRPDMVVEGRAAILDAMNKRPANRICRHMCSTQVVTLTSDDEAEAVTYFAYYEAELPHQGTAALDGPVAIGEYHDRFRRIESGWRIAERSVVVAMQRKSS